MRTSNKLRHLTKDIELRDKVICIIPQWEMHKLSAESFGNYKEAAYILRENYLLAIIRNKFLRKGILSFVAYRNSDDEEFVHLSERDSEITEYLKLHKPKDSFEVNILCIDCRELGHGILNCFLDYAESFLYKQKSGYEDKSKFENFNKLFSRAAVDVKTYSFDLIKKIIDDAYENKLLDEDFDKLDYLSNNHLQNIKKIGFWGAVEPEGYLCHLNTGNLQFSDCVEKDDYRFFYGLEPLLFWELYEQLKIIRRCESCGNVLPYNSNRKTKHCQKGSKNYKDCVKKRANIRQKKHYNKKKKEAIITKSSQ